MRVRVGISCTAITCAGAAVATAGCFANSSGGGGSPPSFDASVDSPFPVDDAGADTFAPTPEAGNDVTVPAIEAGVDAGPEAAVEAGCGPVPITGFVVPPYVHANPQSIVCSDSEDAWFAQQCFGSGSTLASCANFATSSAPDAGPDAGPFIQSVGCAPCLVTPANSDAGYGPGVAGTVVAPNIAGCIELNDSSDAGISCAMAVQAAAACVDYACKTSCPVTDNASRAAYLTCTSVASSGVCNVYTQAATACIAAEIGDAGNSTVQQWCFSSTDPATQLSELSLFFCSS